MLGLSACAHSKIPQTEIDDTADNRAILDVIGAYHRAFEGRDADALIRLVSPRYFEDNGNTDRSDDYDFSGLKAHLSAEFAKTKTVQLEMRVDDIKVAEERGFAVIFYTLRAESDFPSGPKWKTGTDRARIGFEHRDGKWMIVSGL